MLSPKAIEEAMPCLEGSGKSDQRKDIETL